MHTFPHIQQSGQNYFNTITSDNSKLFDHYALHTFSESLIDKSRDSIGTRRECCLCQTRNLSSIKTNIDGPFQPDYVIDPGKAGITLDEQTNPLRIDDSPASLNVNDSSSLVLDSLSALNSPLIESLLVNAKWGNVDPDSGNPTELSYYISQPGDTVDVGTSTFSPAVTPTTAESNIISASNSAFTDVANLIFTETSDQSVANFAWSVVTDSDAALGIADFPGNSGVSAISHVVLDRNSYSDTDMQTGGYYFLTYPHELGHALGLAHPHNGGSFGWNGYQSATIPGFTEGVSNRFTETADNDLNSTPFQLMTYVDSGSQAKIAGSDGTVDQYLSPRSSSSAGYLENLGPIDIATLQYLYGPKTTTATEDNTYLLDNASLNGYKTIWDNGGDDTISAINSSAAVVIDLRNATLTNEVGGGGFVSKIDDLYRGYTIAYNTTGTAVIENATGSAYSDRIIGNSAANTINGGTGVDTMAGGTGDDTYIVDSTSDVVNENSSEGTDLIEASVSFTAAGNVENLTLSGSSNIIATGNSLANTLTGNSGDNTIDGDAGNDTMAGGTGNDTLTGQSGADQFRISSGDDLVTDFSSSEGDTIGITYGLTYTLADVGSNLKITTSDGASITLQGLQVASFNTSTDLEVIGAPAPSGGGGGGGGGGAPAPTPTPSPAPTPTPTPAPALSLPPTPTPIPDSVSTIEVPESQLESISFETIGDTTTVTTESEITDMTINVGNPIIITGEQLNQPTFQLNSNNTELTLLNIQSFGALIKFTDGKSPEDTIINFSNAIADSSVIEASTGQAVINVDSDSSLTGKSIMNLGGNKDSVVIDGIINKLIIDNGDDNSKDKITVSDLDNIQKKLKINNFGEKDRLIIEGEKFNYQTFDDKELRNELKDLGIIVTLLD